MGGGIFLFFVSTTIFIHIRDRVSIKMPFVAGGGGSVNNQQKSVCGENTKYIWQNGKSHYRPFALSSLCFCYIQEMHLMMLLKIIIVNHQ